MAQTATNAALPAMLYAAVVLIEPKVQKEFDAGFQKQQGYIRDDAVEIRRSEHSGPYQRRCQWKAMPIRPRRGHDEGPQSV